MTIWRQVVFGKNGYEFLLKLATAFLSAHFVVVQGTKYSWYELFQHGFYYASLGWSMLIAWLLISYVHYTVTFNFTSPQDLLNVTKLVRQFLVGGVGGLVLAILLALLLFHSKGYAILNTRYFRVLFLPIVLFVWLLNILFYLRQLVAAKMKKQIRFVKAPLPSQQQLFQVQDKEKYALLFYTLEKSCFVFYNTGECLLWPNTITHTFTQLDATQYFKGDRRFILHRDLIASYETRDTVYLTLNLVMAVPVMPKISKRNAQHFKEWFNETETVPITSA